MSCHLLVLVFLFVPVIGYCAELAPPPRPKTIYYFPVTVGAKRVYTCWYKYAKKDHQHLEFTEVVTAVKDGKDGAKIVTVEHLDARGKTTSTEVYEVSERGLFIVEDSGGKPLDHPRCELKLPHKDGQTWCENPELDTNLTAHGQEKHKVPAGDFDCIRVDFGFGKSSHPFSTSWYAPGVGIVEWMSQSIVVSLKSFTPGNE
jgi:hypothetical protein